VVFVFLYALISFAFAEYNDVKLFYIAVQTMRLCGFF